MTMPPIPALETERLSLRPYAISDAPVVQRLFPHWEVIQHLHAEVPWPYPDDGALTFLKRATADNEAGLKNHWAICPKGSAELIGSISLWPDDGTSRDMRGFWLAPEFWGHGYMSEAADRVTDYALVELGWPRLWLGNAIDNLRSARVKQRQGAELVGVVERDFASGRKLRQTWLITREAWRTRRGLELETDHGS